MKRRFLFLLMAVCSFVGANAALNRTNNYLEAASATAEQGKTVEVALTMVNNTKEIINWQTDLVLPEGITLVSAVAADRWSEAIQVEGVRLFSETETPVATGRGVVAKFTLQVAATVAPGEYDLALTGIVMHTPDGTEIAQTENKGFKLTVTEASEPGIKGDLNDDDYVDASDIQVILNDMANETNDPKCDLNSDGFIDASDIQVILNIMAEQ